MKMIVEDRAIVDVVFGGGPRHFDIDLPTNARACGGILVVMRIALLVLCIAACDGGIVIEVKRFDAQTTRVQLFLGFSECHDCPGIAPPPIGTAIRREVLPGDVYFREDLADGALFFEADVESDGYARFKIDPNGQTGAMLAVAVDASHRSAAIIRNVRLDTSTKYRVDLAMSMGALGPNKPANTTGNFVEIWQQPQAQFPCMGFERWQNGQLYGERVFIVPSDDLDCDEAPGGSNECAPFSYKGGGTPKLGEATCIDPFSIGDNTTCRPGGIACDEAMPSSPACAPTDYCLPSAYCDPAVNPTCDLITTHDAVAKCLFESPPPLTAHLRCTVGFRPSTDGTHADLCDGTTGIHFNLFDNTRAEMTCASLPFVEGKQLPFLVQPSPNVLDYAFAEELDLTTRDAATWMMKAKLHHFSEPKCDYKLELGGDRANQPIGDDRPVFVQFWVSNNSGPIRKMLVPLVIAPINDCMRPPECKLMLGADDALAECVAR
jgi:hypothetical protein